MRDGGSTGPRRRSPGRTRRRPGPLARALARLVVRAADGSTRLVTALLGASPTAGREQISEAELRDLVAANTRLDPVERRIIDEVLVAGASLVREVMMPRTEVVFLAAGLPLTEAAQLVRVETHTRYPVVDGTSDDVIGFVHLRDVLLRPDDDACATIGDLTREVKKIPASLRVLAALTEMRRERHHLAVVIDEYGGTAGIVTLEDLIEELVGEIHDEYDTAPDPVPVGGPTEVDGRLNLADFAERAGFALPPGPYETVGGFVMAALGRLPVRGDEVRVPGVQAAGGSGGAGRSTGGFRNGGDPEDGSGGGGGGGWLLLVLAVEGRRVARVGISAARPSEQQVPDQLTWSLRQVAPSAE
ncbi:hemolysin family protein [Plantactinospora sp. WMMC1484]|uniref:hemolysin family protein n=1 Tax=Plantactinospora sp. WMMC1484 TaxID=3404122 RepID=UPI003BF4F129